VPRKVSAHTAHHHIRTLLWISSALVIPSAESLPMLEGIGPNPVAAAALRVGSGIVSRAAPRLRYWANPATPLTGRRPKIIVPASDETFVATCAAQGWGR